MEGVGVAFSVGGEDSVDQLVKLLGSPVLNAGNLHLSAVSLYF